MTVAEYTSYFPFDIFYSFQNYFPFLYTQGISPKAVASLYKLKEKKIPEASPFYTGRSYSFFLCSKRKL